MKLNRRQISIAMLAILVSFLLGALSAYTKPRLQNWLLVQIEKTSRETLPVRILPTSIKIGFVPVAIDVEGVRILPNPEMKDHLDPFTINHIQLNLSFLSLLQGKIRFRSIGIEGADLTLRVPKTDSQSDKPLATLFKLLPKLPIQKIWLRDLSAKVHLDDPQADLVFAKSTLQAEIQNDNLAIDINLPAVLLSDKESTAKLKLAIETRALIERKTLTLSALKVRRDDSFFVASGTVRGDIEALKFQSINFASRNSLALKNLRTWIVKTFPKYRKIPELDGKLTSEINIQKDSNKPATTEFKASTDNLMIDKIFLDKVAAVGQFNQEQIRFKSFKIENKGVRADGSNLRIKIQDKVTLSGLAHIEELNLHELFKTVGVGTIPVFWQVTSEMPCEGELYPQFLLTCHPKLNGKNLDIRGSMTDTKSIAKVLDVSAQGDVTITPTEVSYSGQVQMPLSHGTSKGTINIEKGFDVSFAADHFDFKDIQDLAQLKIEGRGSLQGTVSGDSHAAIFDIALDGEDVWFENYGLGHFKSDLSYRSGILKFANSNGNYKTSRYSAQLEVNLLKHQLQVAAQSPFLDMSDLLFALSRRVQLPFKVDGTGSMSVKAWGPFAFTALNYDFKSAVFKGSIMDEPFDQARFNVHSRNGEVKSDLIKITRGEGSVTMEGVGHPDGNIRTIVRGSNLRIEDSPHVKLLGLGLAGYFDFNMDVFGYVLGPDNLLKGTITKTTLGEEVLPNSEVSLKITNSTVEGEAQVFENIVQTSFIYPLKEHAPFRLKSSFKNWNFSPFLYNIGGSALRRDYQAHVSGEFDINSPKGGFWNSSGLINIQNLGLIRGTQSLHTDEPIVAEISQGHLNIQKFELKGENSFIKLTSESSNSQPIDLQANGKLDLNLMSIFLPFFEDIRGVLTFTSSIKANPDRSDIVGSVFIDKAFIKLFNLIHPIEELRADVMFNQKKILVNSYSSLFAGGHLVGEGQLELKGFHNFPLKLSGHLEKATLNIPDKFKTTGDASVTIAGSWFPYFMKGTYTISSGLISKELGGDDDKQKSVVRSSFLPQTLLKEAFVPLLFDLQIQIPDPIDVKNDSVQAKVKGDVHFQGTPSKPSLLGKIDIEKNSKVTFNDKTFDVQLGSLEFVNPIEIDPKLAILAQAKVQDKTQSYDITVNVQGFASKPLLRFSSEPALTEPDIISLIALGATSSQLDSNVDSTQQASSGSIAIVNALLSKNPVGKELKSRFGLDLSLSQSIDDSSSAAVQKITVSRQITPKFGVTGTRSVGKNGKTEGKASYQLNKGVSVVGSIESQDQEENTDQTKKATGSSQTMGVDLEYKFEFK